MEVLGNNKDKMSVEEQAAEQVMKYCTVYIGNTDDLEELTARKSVIEAGWNRHLPCPLKDKIFMHPTQENVDNKYVRVIHSDFKVISVFNKLDFTKWGKDDEEETGKSAFRVDDDTKS